MNFIFKRVNKNLGIITKNLDVIQVSNIYTGFVTGIIETSNLMGLALDTFWGLTRERDQLETNLKLNSLT